MTETLCADCDHDEFAHMFYREGCTEHEDDGPCGCMRFREKP